MSVILEFGTEEQKERHVPPILRGETFWMQFLSEPSGGSDLAGALTTAVRDGDEWVLNGSKIWTTGAWWADWALCLARTNWDVPKHRGLTVFMLEIHQPGIEVHRIEMLNGSREFCQEFMTDVRVPDSQRIGQVDEGWAVAVQMDVPRAHHRRRLALRHGPGRATGGGARPDRRASRAPLRWSDSRGLAEDTRVKEQIGESLALSPRGRRPDGAISPSRSGPEPPPTSGPPSPACGTARPPSATRPSASISSGPAPWPGPTRSGSWVEVGIRFLMRQASCIAGGTTEMARNAISERVLGMPRERRVDLDMPFRDVPRNALVALRT